MAFNSNFFDPFGDLKSKNKKNFSDDPLDFGYGNSGGDTSNGKAGKKGEGGSGSDNDSNSGRRRSGSSSPSPDDDIPEDEEWPSAPPIDILDSIKASCNGQVG